MSSDLPIIDSLTQCQILHANSTIPEIAVGAPASYLEVRKNYVTEFPQF